MKNKVLIFIIVIACIIGVLIMILFYIKTKNSNTFDNYTATVDQGGIPEEKAIGTNIFINDSDARTSIDKDIYKLLQSSINIGDAGTLVFIEYDPVDKIIRYKDNAGDSWKAKLTSDRTGFLFLRDWS